MKYISPIIVIIVLCVAINMLQMYFKMSNLFSFAAAAAKQPSMLDTIHKLQSQLRYHPSQKVKSQLQDLQNKYNHINSPEGQAAMQQAVQVQAYLQQQAQQQQNQNTLDWINSVQDALQHPPKGIKPNI
jgi:Tfp pilus assembly protein PilE